MNGWFVIASATFVVGLVLASPYAACGDGSPDTQQAFTLMLWGMLCLVVAVVLAVIGVFV